MKRQRGSRYLAIVLAAAWCLIVLSGRVAAQEVDPATQPSHEDLRSINERLDAIERDVVEFKVARSFFNATLNSHVAICVAIVVLAIGAMLTIDLFLLKGKLVKYTDQKLDELRATLKKRFGELEKNMAIAQAQRNATTFSLIAGLSAPHGHHALVASSWLESAYWSDRAGDSNRTLFALQRTYKELQGMQNAADVTPYRNDFGTRLAMLEAKEKYQELIDVINKQLARIDKGEA